MASKESWSKESCLNELTSAVRQLSDRCLLPASKWAAELLVGIEPSSPSSSSLPRPSGATPPSSALRHRLRLCAQQNSNSNSNAGSPGVSTPLAGVSYVSVPVPADDEGPQEGERFYLLAKACFECREFRRAAHFLRDQSGKKADFLRMYALYMAGEKRKEEESVELSTSASNSSLPALHRELSALRRAGALDPFGLYLLGVVLRAQGRAAEAGSALAESVRGFPWNWAAWGELLGVVCGSEEEVRGVERGVGGHWMKEFFMGAAFLELKMHEEALETYKRLQLIFPHSLYIQAQIATAHYSMRELDESESIFEELLRADPFRTESMDTYSNVLYAKESFSTLSYLAHRLFLSDKYKAESCCAIANYYSLKGLHEKSVVYFKRALKLNPKYLSAWTLMGHEYVEMKNTPAAIDAYRRAVEIDGRDYRAWYGLGQMYEMMAMATYALYYYRKASMLQPHDARLWIAMAHCYENTPLSSPHHAIRCYKRAAECNDPEGIALHKLAELHGEIGQADEAAFFYRKDLERMDEEERQGPNYVQALLFLAKHCKALRRFDEAEGYATRLLDTTGPEKEAAKSILRGLKKPRSFSLMDIDDFTPERDQDQEENRGNS